VPETFPLESKDVEAKWFGFVANSKNNMPPVLVSKPARVAAAGTKPKLIDEYIGRVNTETQGLSVAHMRSPGGWVEPGQTPDFDEYTVVLRGTLRVESQQGVLDVQAGQAVLTPKGEWVRYSTPEPDGAEYIAVCHPAFTLDGAHRDQE
jgi:mannose-6-phosphate isomerase-like protein (cupin superfamily)